MYKLLEIEREAFAEWLKEHPETPFTPCHGDECPLAIYLSHRDQQNYCVMITTAQTEGPNSDSYFMPNWATRFINKVDQYKTMNGKRALRLLGTIKKD